MKIRVVSIDIACFRLKVLTIKLWSFIYLTKISLVRGILAYPNGFLKSSICNGNIYFINHLIQQIRLRQLPKDKKPSWSSEIDPIFDFIYIYLIFVGKNIKKGLSKKEKWSNICERDEVILWLFIQPLFFNNYFMWGHCVVFYYRGLFLFNMTII